MYRKLATTVFIMIATLALISCRSAPVYNVNNAIVSANVSNVTSAQVRKAIIRAGSGLGWKLQDAGPGKLAGTLRLRKHVAKIDIPYSSRNYSIRYKSSNNLRYDGTTIHSNYNGWIQRLDEAIQIQLKNL